MLEQEYTSPDGHLTLRIETADDGDRSIGFRGYRWHIHADLLAKCTGLSEDAALQSFVDAILNDETLIAVLSRDGNIEDIWVCDDPECAFRHKQAVVPWGFRFWGGPVL